MFWFFTYEGINDSFPEPITTTVPTAAERNGDFSALLKAGSNYQIYDPRTAVSQGSTFTRQPFTNNVVPSDRLSPIAKAYLQFYPLPNQPGGIDSKNNYLANSVRTDTYNGELGRIVPSPFAGLIPGDQFEWLECRARNAFAVVSGVHRSERAARQIRASRTSTAWPSAWRSGTRMASTCRQTTPGPS